MQYREVLGHGRRHFGYCRGRFEVEAGDKAVLEYQVVQYAPRGGGSAKAKRVISDVSGTKTKVKIAIDGVAGNRISTFRPVVTGNVWRRLELPITQQGMYVLHLVNKETSPISLRLRNKVDYFASAQLHEKLQKIFAGRPAKYLLQLLFASLSFVVLLQARNRSRVLRFSFFLAISFLFFYRLNLSFAIDEWDLLKRLNDGGLAAALVTHNEHFIPVFSLFYYAQFSAFAGAYHLYILVSLLLHCATAMLIESFVLRLLSGSRHADKTAYAASVIYLLSCLHAESIQWSICQSTLLFMTSGLVSLILSWDYFERGGIGRLLAVLLALVMALFSFGAAFILLLQIPLFVAYQCYLKRESIDPSLAIRRGFKLLSPVFLVGVSAAGMYWLKRDGFGIGVDDLRPNSLGDILTFAAVGTQFGTVLRATGAYPFEGFGQLAAVTPSFIPTGIFGFFCGLFISLGLLFYYRTKQHDTGRATMLWLIGQGCIIMPMALVAIGRAGYGLHHSYVLRYQSPAIFGFCLLCLPLLQRAFQKINSGEGRWKFALLAVLFLFSQLHFLRAHILYTFNGALQQSAVEQLLFWNQVNHREPFDSKIPFEASGRELEGLQPLFYWGHPGSTGAILPFVHPDTMLNLVMRKKGTVLEQINESE